TRPARASVARASSSAAALVGQTIRRSQAMVCGVLRGPSSQRRWVGGNDERQALGGKPDAGGVQDATAARPGWWRRWPAAAAATPKVRSLPPVAAGPEATEPQLLH